MHSPFSSLAPFAPLAETVEARVFAPGSSAIVRSSVQATVHAGAGLANGVGASVSTETGDGYTLQIFRRDWPFPYPPAMGHRFGLADFGMVVAKSVLPVVGGWSVRCVQDQRAEPRT